MAAGDLTTLASVKAWLGVTAATEDATLTRLITAISTFVPQALQRQILSATYTETYRGNGKDRTLLRQRPVTAIASVGFCGQTITAQGDPFAETPGIWTDGKSLVLVGYRMPYGAPVSVTYTAGYPTTPFDVEQAVIELVGEAYTSKTHIGETSHSQGGQTTVAFSQKAMHESIRNKLSNYLAVAPLC